ncbi:aminotransferase class IV [Spirochaetia bacterium 38H-sp]|uniref:branched-chain-amino-acid transaminase n=1 Tax=Rarispira pelagica TaxID=3141764 RepID=A0ABU9UBJ3_9SPIR
MGLGSGIRIWGSPAQGKLSGAIPPGLALIESLLWEPHKGAYLKELHAERLISSAEQLGFDFDREEILQKIISIVDNIQASRPQKLRIVMSQNGEINTETIDAQSTAPTVPVKLFLSNRPIPQAEWWLYFKTTHRPFYEHQKRIQQKEHLLFYTKDGFVTETDFANIIVEKEDGTLVSPPVETGLLPGTMRQHLLETGIIREEAIKLKELKGKRLFICNSVRKILPAELTV